MVSIDYSTYFVTMRVDSLFILEVHATLLIKAKKFDLGEIKIYNQTPCIYMLAEARENVLTVFFRS